MSTLTRITAGAISAHRQWKVRLEICRAVHGRGCPPAPAWRVGSNAPLATAEPDSYGVDEPCQHCGAPGADIVGTSCGDVGLEYCRACGADWIVGDYDWRNLSDCLRYRTDLADGMVAAP